MSYNSKNLLKKFSEGRKSVKRAPLCPKGTPHIMYILAIKKAPEEASFTLHWRYNNRVIDDV